MYAITTRIQIKKTEYDIFFQIVKEQPSLRRMKRKPSPMRPLALHTSHAPTPGKTGGGERDRTDDPLLAKQVLSQLSYTPR